MCQLFTLIKIIERTAGLYSSAAAFPETVQILNLKNSLKILKSKLRKCVSVLMRDIDTAILSVYAVQSGILWKWLNILS